MGKRESIHFFCVLFFTFNPRAAALRQANECYRKSLHRSGVVCMTFPLLPLPSSSSSSGSPFPSSRPSSVLSAR
uniref:Putative secreted protein n=1 Tax=Anopheles darlingi TaxID=43151 RepID=A0A2M4DM34_ANODA